jgi:hypothetical protein
MTTAKSEGGSELRIFAKGPRHIFDEKIRLPERGANAADLHSPLRYEPPGAFMIAILNGSLMRRDSGQPIVETEGIAVGNAKRVLETCKAWESIGVDGIKFMIQSLETVPQEQVLAILRLFAKELMPYFRGDKKQAAA